jgi:asparagine synthase (glutamine-hydrolysing)
MCGIAGIVSVDGFDPQTLMAMTHLVSHRGPNGFGFAYSMPGQVAPVEIIHNEDRVPRMSRPVIGLGSRRLAILDVSREADMPLQIEDGAYSIVFNGEIYNYKEIRQQLETLGHRFVTLTDTEVILRAYQKWGEDCLHRFNGMWSFALWDKPKQRLFCSRDRFGVKPFFFTSSPRHFIFGSEIKQVLTAANLSRVANPRAVLSFLEWGLLDHSSETFFEGVHQLSAGHSLTLDLSASLNPTIRRYWELRLEPQLDLSVERATEEFQSRFTHAVRIRLRSDVPVGVCLSGGLDSSAILCKARQIAPETQFQTFSACFRDKALDERDYILAVVSATRGIPHATFPDGQEFWKTIHSIVYHHDEPVGSPSVFAQWSVMQDARAHSVPVVLGGQGGDEILCGYQKYRYFYLWHLFRHADPKFLRELLMCTRNGTSSYWTMGSLSRYLPKVFHRRFSLAQRICSPEFQEQARRPIAELGAAASIAERQKTDLLFSSIPALLRHEDRNAMAHSVESRLPFLDYELAQFAVNCPPSLKLRDGWSKWLLRHATADTLPDKVRLRKTKLGFNTPDAEWMRLGLQNGQRKLWDTPDLKMARFLKARTFAQECRKFLQAAPGALPANSIFRAISLELWARVHCVS